MCNHGYQLQSGLVFFFCGWQQLIFGVVLLIRGQHYMENIWENMGENMENLWDIYGLWNMYENIWKTGWWFGT